MVIVSDLEMWFPNVAMVAVPREPLGSKTDVLQFRPLDQTNR